MSSPHHHEPIDRGLWRHADFLRLWAAQAFSAFGSRITRTALPIIAVTTLGQPEAMVGLLAAMQLAPGVVLAMAAGGFIDRGRKRRILIASDVIRAGLVASLTLAWALGGLTMLQVIVVGAAVGAATALFQITDNAYLPALIGRRRLLEGNAKLETTEAIAEITGPASAGVLIAALGAPLTVVIDAASYLWSAFMLRQIRAEDVPGKPTARATRNPGGAKAPGATPAPDQATTAPGRFAPRSAAEAAASGHTGAGDASELPRRARTDGPDGPEASALPVRARADDADASALPVRAGADGPEAPALPVRAGADGPDAPALPVRAGAADAEASALPVRAGAADAEASALPVRAHAADAEASALPVRAHADGLDASALPVRARADGPDASALPVRARADGPDAFDLAGHGADEDTGASELSVRTGEDFRIGLRAVFGNPLVRPIVLNLMVWSIAGGFFSALYTLFCLRELGMSEATFGVIIAIGGVGSLAGAALARSLARLLGVGRTLLVTSALSMACTLFIPIAASATSPVMMIGFLVAHQLLSDGFAVAFIVLAVTLRQTVLPRDLLGRANAAVHVCTTGVLPVAALLAGGLAELIGIQAAVWVGLSIGLVAPVFLWRLRTLKDMPVADLSASDSALVHTGTRD